VLILHDPNDRAVAFRHTKKYLGLIPRATYLEHYLGHKLTRDLLSAFWKEIDKFIKINYLKDEEREKEGAKERERKRGEKEEKDLKKAISEAEKEKIEVKVVGSEKANA
jgi:hypothetical protein